MGVECNCVEPLLLHFVHFFRPVDFFSFTARHGRVIIEQKTPVKNCWFLSDTFAFGAGIFSPPFFIPFLLQRRSVQMSPGGK